VRGTPPPPLAAIRVKALGDRLIPSTPVQARAHGRRSVAVVAAIGSVLVGVGVASGAPGDPMKHLVAADQTYARSVLLRTSDLPALAWQVKPTDFSQPNPPCLVRRYSLSALIWTGLAGRTFTSGGTLAASDVEVFSTVAQSRRAFAILFEPGLEQCLAGALAAGISKSAAGVTARVARIDRFTLPFSEPTHGFRVLLHVSSAQGEGSVDLVEVAILHGRGLGALSMAGLPSIWPQSTVRTLAATLRARLASHRLSS
jgi:hypothetical protein